MMYRIVVLDAKLRCVSECVFPANFEPNAEANRQPNRLGTGYSEAHYGTNYSEAYSEAHCGTSYSEAYYQNRECYISFSPVTELNTENTHFISWRIIAEFIAYFKANTQYDIPSR